MSKLPQHETAFVPVERISGYLVSGTHPDGKAKAAFFTRFGFSAGEPDVLLRALLRHRAENDVAEVKQTPFGIQYIVEGPLASPNGRDPAVRSAWVIEHGETTPRFVTAYPLPRRQRVV